MCNAYKFIGGGRSRGAYVFFIGHFVWLYGGVTTHTQKAYNFPLSHKEDMFKKLLEKKNRGRYFSKGWV
jgi:hypothetical protein